jgi:hypothetical protein
MPNPIRIAFLDFSSAISKATHALKRIVKKKAKAVQGQFQSSTKRLPKKGGNKSENVMTSGLR